MGLPVCLHALSRRAGDGSRVPVAPSAWKAPTLVSGAAALLALLMPLTIAAPARADEATPAQHAIEDLGDLYRRADQHLDRNLADARAILDRFRALYMEDNIPVPVIGRRAKANEDDIREYISEMRRGIIAHRNNARVVGRIADWPERMQEWAAFNFRMSTKRLWQIKILESQHAFGLLKHDAEIAFQSIAAERDAELEALAEAGDSDTTARSAYLSKLAKAETERSEALAARARAIAADLADWRARLARRSWRWMALAEEMGTERQIKATRSLILGSFMFDLPARQADPTDPYFQSDVAEKGDLDWLIRMERDPEALGLRVLSDPEERPAGTPVPLAFTSILRARPVEAFDTRRVTRPVHPSRGSALARAAIAIDDLHHALADVGRREEIVLAGLSAAVDGQRPRPDLVEGTQGIAREVAVAMALLRKPVEAGTEARAEEATLTGLRARRSRLIDSRTALSALSPNTPETDETATAPLVVETGEGLWAPAGTQTGNALPVGRALDQIEAEIADLDVALETGEDRLARLRRARDEAVAALSKNDDLTTQWTLIQTRFTALKADWQGQDTTLLNAALPALPEALPVLDLTSPQATLAALQETFSSLKVFLAILKPATGVTKGDTAALLAALDRIDEQRLHLVEALGALRVQALQLAAVSLDGQSEGSASAAETSGAPEDDAADLPEAFNKTATALQSEAGRWMAAMHGLGRHLEGSNAGASGNAGAAGNTDTAGAPSQQSPSVLTGLEALPGDLNPVPEAERRNIAGKLATLRASLAVTLSERAETKIPVVPTTEDADVEADAGTDAATDTAIQTGPDTATDTGTDAETDPEESAGEEAVVALPDPDHGELIGALLEAAEAGLPLRGDAAFLLDDAWVQRTGALVVLAQAKDAASAGLTRDTTLDSLLETLARRPLMMNTDKNSPDNGMLHHLD